MGMLFINKDWKHGDGRSSVEVVSVSKNKKRSTMHAVNNMRRLSQDLKNRRQPF